MKLYTSKSLSKLWPNGFSTVGALNYDTAAYTARYIMKKVTGDPDAKFARYAQIDPSTGEVVGYLEPEYTTMSRRPGIGHGFFTAFQDDIYPSDFLIENGRQMLPPKYYDNQFEIVSPGAMARIKSKRIKEAKKHAIDNTVNRLRVREAVKLAQIKNLKRSLE